MSILTTDDAELSNTVSLRGRGSVSIVFGAPVAWLWMWRLDKDGEGRKLGGTLRREGVVYDGLRDRGVCDIYSDSG